MNRIAYYTNEGFETPDGVFVIALVEENVAGWTPSGFTADSIRDARVIAQLLNEKLGVLYDEALDMVASSIRLQNLEDAR